MGGREGMPRSLGSVYGACVTLFLGGGLRGVVSRVIATRVVKSDCGIAVSRDGCTVLTLLVSDNDGGSHTLRQYSIADGTLLRLIGGPGTAARARCASHPTTLCSSQTPPTTACRC
jgi:hypothetical protein